MSRLFLTTRELDFISDITKELISDVVGQEIIYYPISELKTLSHDVYDESVRKIFDAPIRIGALVDNSFEQDTKINSFGIDKQFKIEVFMHSRDLVDRGIDVAIGDYFTFSDVLYEVTEERRMRNIYGFAEHADGVRVVGSRARQDALQVVMQGPTDIRYSDEDAVQEEFVQQRGFAENKLGSTGDKRELRVKGVLDEPITGPKEVSQAGTTGLAGAAFYGEDE